ncbi:MAG: HD domain-containing protein [Anaerolineales bacterium]|nr:HD domain-containing protein [Anaerolineales bacterium]
MNVLDQVLAFIADQNVEAYFVGGLVRDELLSRVVKRDLDLALDGDASELARAFADQNGGAFYLMDEEHNVARVILGDTYIDFAQLRGALREDLATRDFTINAMARQLGSNELFDPFHGQKHLALKQICAVSDEAFQNDPVRLLRALRFAGELGFTIGAHTEKLIRRDAHLLAFASMERARDEFFKILALPNSTTSLRQMDALGLLSAFLPEVVALKGVAQSPPHAYDAFEHTLRVLDELEMIQADEYAQVANGEFAAELQTHFAQIVSAERARGTLLRLAALLHDIGKAQTRSVDDAGAIHFYDHEPRGAVLGEAAMRRLRFSNDEVAIVTRVITDHLRPAHLAREARVSNRAVYRFFRDAGDAGIDTCVLTHADRRGKGSTEIEADDDARQRATNAQLLDRYFHARATVIAPPALVDGHTLIKELGLAPGKRVGELLEAIREAQAEGEVKSREDALAFARTIFATDAPRTENTGKKIRNQKSEI